MAKRLDPNILQILHERTGKTIATLRKEVSLAKREFPGATSNAAAQIVAIRHRTSVLQKLDAQDRATVPQTASASTPPQGTARQSYRSKKSDHKPAPPLFDYETVDYFKQQHIKELFKANRASCFTCVFILFRKILENLLIDIIRAKFPGNNKENVELYYNTVQKRFHDFSEILECLKERKGSFGIDGEKVIDRIIQLTKPFKKDANDKAHSWFHIVDTGDEIRQIPLQTIIELVKKLEIVVGLRPIVASGAK